jgi:phosphatidylserine/phosphatidylglycerophosphate/cardiolipin synthase-like enzyme
MNIGITVWNGRLLDDYLSELEAFPKSFAKVVIASPYLNIGGPTRIARRIQMLVRALIRSGAKVSIVSDMTRVRGRSFEEFAKSEPKMASSLGLYPRLHSKCGYAISKTGAHIGFVGSANVTHAALTFNREILIAVKTTPSRPETSTLFREIHRETDALVSSAFGLTHSATRRLLRDRPLAA